MNKDEALEALKAYALPEFRASRAECIRQARALGVTWRTIADLTGMTQLGAQKAAER